MAKSEIKSKTQKGVLPSFILTIHHFLSPRFQRRYVVQIHLSYKFYIFWVLQHFPVYLSYNIVQGERERERIYGTNGEVFNGGRSSNTSFDLGHLTDLLFQGHSRKKVFDSFFNGCIWVLVNAIHIGHYCFFLAQSEFLMERERDRDREYLVFRSFAN